MNEGKRSIYRIIREDELKYTRQDASDVLDGITPERLEKIEQGKIKVLPEDIISLVKGYDKPELYNYYCNHECKIGEIIARDVKLKDLNHVAVQVLNSMNRLSEMKDRFLEIVEDDNIAPEEYDDFMKIRDNLETIAETADGLRIMAEKIGKNIK